MTARNKSENTEDESLINFGKIIKPSGKTIIVSQDDEICFTKEILRQTILWIASIMESLDEDQCDKSLEIIHDLDEARHLLSQYQGNTLSAINPT